ncbi:MAG: enoyl-CoA hydratase/isomerase family protein [Actinobacteria bacterium]|nr:enoyl-CoA hydratase/isomerase family protein [Actinomycetota bacterium]
MVEFARPETAVVRLNRPASLNALTRELLEELLVAFDRLQGDPAVRAIVLTGAGRGFSSGHDLADLRREAESGDVARQLENQRAFSDLILKINESRLPVIAAVNGPAAGGGLAMALAADTRVCGRSARFNAAFVKLGISGCDVGVSYLLPRIVGPTLAFEMMMSGRLIDADEALHSGLVLRVSPDDQVLEVALEVADAICANRPFAVEMTKELMWANLDAPSLRQAILVEDRTQTLCLQTGDFRRVLQGER